MLLAKTHFTARLIEANGFDPSAFKRWVFSAGMLFKAPDKWWGDYGRRDFPHEGLDFCLYRDAANKLRRLDEGTRIPVMHDGLVRALFNDYLGQAIVVEHKNLPALPGKAIAIYAHTKPLEGILPGVGVRAGEIIACIAGTGRSKTNILPHLHFSIGRPSSKMVYEPFVWNQMRDSSLMTLKNPQGLADWPYEVLDAEWEGTLLTSLVTGAGA